MESTKNHTSLLIFASCALVGALVFVPIRKWVIVMQDLGSVHALVQECRAVADQYESVAKYVEAVSEKIVELTDTIKHQSAEIDELTQRANRLENIITQIKHKSATDEICRNHTSDNIVAKINDLERQIEATTTPRKSLSHSALPNSDYLPYITKQVVLHDINTPYETREIP